jgi:hypothetical protein
MKLSSKSLYLIFTILVGLGVSWTFLNYEPFLSQGDHGRDLYCIQKTSEGQHPYRDFWWEYGPGMLYYYAGLFKVLGPTIQTAVFGKQVVVFASGIMMYLAASQFLPPIWAFMIGIFFFAFRPEFFYTFNHAGAMLMIISMLFFLFRFYRLRDHQSVFGALICIFFLNLIRINFGFSCLTGLFISLWVYSRVYQISLPWKEYAKAAFAMVILSLSIYVFLTIGMPFESFMKCFPYLPQYHTDSVSKTKFLMNMLNAIWYNFKQSIPRALFGFLLLTLSARLIYLWRKNKVDQKQLTVLLFSTGLFTVFNIHEYFISEYFFRLFWAFPSLVLFFFTIIYFGTATLSSKVRQVVEVSFSIALLISCLGVARINFYYQKPMNVFEYGPHKLYITNIQWGEHKKKHNWGAVDHFAAPKWSKVVRETADYLKANLKEDETFLAVPYDAMYYFLTGKTSPVYLLAFFPYINISPQEELWMIAQMEAQKVNWVLLSNRAVSNEVHIGVMGKDYCPTLTRYILRNFTVDATIGDWNQKAFYSIHHSVRIYKRKEPVISSSY